jgi:hypothetical protein
MRIRQHQHTDALGNRRGQPLEVVLDQSDHHIGHECHLLGIDCPTHAATGEPSQRVHDLRAPLGHVAGITAANRRPESRRDRLRQRKIHLRDSGGENVGRQSRPLLATTLMERPQIGHVKIDRHAGHPVTAARANALRSTSRKDRSLLRSRTSSTLDSPARRPPSTVPLSEDSSQEVDERAVSSIVPLRSSARPDPTADVGHLSGSKAVGFGVEVHVMRLTADVSRGFARLSITATNRRPLCPT